MDKNKDKNTENTKDKEDKKVEDVTDRSGQEDVITIDKDNYDNLLEQIGKLQTIEDMLVKAEKEKRELKFQNLKQKHKLDEALCDLLGITADTKEEDIAAKLDKFKEIVGAGGEKDDAAFLKTPTTKTAPEDKIKQLIKEGKIQEALTLKLQK